MRATFVALILLATACKDADGDGQGAARDCDDSRGDVFEGAVEVCNGRDDDCDGQIDEGVSITAWQDRDGDGFGDPSRGRRVCTLPEDGVENDQDCNDVDATTNPEASEICDGADNDCDTEIDEGVLVTFYADGDGDGHGVPGDTTEACVVPSGYSRAADDCDDADDARWSDAPELCDGIDNDCDDLIDEDVVEVALFIDADGDGFGDPDTFAYGCGPGDGLSDNGFDCDDTDPTLNPDTVEIEGNSIDDDCDEWVDELAVPDAYPDIMTAVDAASDGEVVQLGDGVFGGTFDLTGRDIVFAGEGCGRTILYGDGSGIGTTLVVDGGTVADMTITGGADAGLRTLGDADGFGLCIENNYAVRFGGGLEVELGTFTLTDSRIVGNASRSEGAGVHVDRTATLIGRRLYIADNATNEDGGGIAVRSGNLYLDASVIASNEAYDDGGGMIVRERLVEPLGPRPVVRLDHVTFHANRTIAPTRGGAGQSAGPGLYVVAGGNSTGDVEIRNTVFSGHALPGEPVIFETPRKDYIQVVEYLALHDNGLLDWRRGNVSDAVRGDPRYVDVSGDPRTWDLRLRPGSALIDAGDPSSDDPNGTRADIGAFGGPFAPADADAPLTEDVDGDGMNDLWERREGLAWWFADASEDPDGDGLDNLGEHDADSDPFTADSDGDGVDDGAEVARGTDPTFDGDSLPFAALERHHPVLVGAIVQLDGTASFDADGTSLGVTWELVPPTTSAVVITASGLDASFVPDVSGPWLVELTVDDGHGTSTDSITVDVVAPDVLVPDDQADLSLAVDNATSGDLIAVRPGTYDVGLSFGGVALNVVGLGEPDEVILRSPGGSTVTVLNGADLTLRNLTLSEGSAVFGGGLYCRESSVVLRDVVLRDNTATLTGGGGAFFDACVVDAERLEVSANTSALHGGGLYFNEDSSSEDVDVRIHDLRLVDNTTADDGGGVYIRHWRGNYDLSNLVVQGNAASEGAGLHLFGVGALSDRYIPIVGLALEPGEASMVAVEQVVFADNDSDGAIVYGDRARLRLVSALYAFNEVAGSAVVDGVDSEIASMSPVFWDNGLATPWGDPSFVPVATTLLDPGVLMWSDDGDAGNDIWTLRPSSALKDQGFTDREDPDGSVSDVGPGGGPDMPRAWVIDGVDADADGMSDGWERRFGLDPTIDDGAADANGDSTNNLDAYRAGISP